MPYNQTTGEFYKDDALVKKEWASKHIGPPKRGVPKDLCHFDVMEVAPVTLLVFDDGDITPEQTEDPKQADFWSVYGHHADESYSDKHGSVRCLGDFKTQAAAAAYAKKMENALTKSCRR